MKRKSANKKNAIKLRLMPSPVCGDGEMQKWVLQPKHNLSEEELTKVRNLIGDNIILPDKSGEIKGFQTSTDVLEKCKLELNSDKREDLEDYTFNDNYFPDDGYNYEQHLCLIGKGHFIPYNHVKEDLDISGFIDINTTVAYNECDKISLAGSYKNEIPELQKCLEEPENFEELNDDFILAASGAQNLKDLQKSIDISQVLWGIHEEPNNLRKFGDTINKLNSNLNSSEEVSEFFFKDKKCELSENNTSQDIFDQILKEYDDNYELEDELPSENPDNNLEIYNNKLEQNISRKMTLKECENLLDKYISMATSGLKQLKKDRKDKSTNTILYKPLEGETLEKILSIIERIKLDDDIDTESITSYESDDDINWDCESVLTTMSNLYNRPCKIKLPQKIYSNSQKTFIKLDPQKNIPTEYLPKKSTITRGLVSVTEDNILEDNKIPNIGLICIERRRNETKEERKQRKEAVKNARRAMRELRRRNKQQVKDVKSTVAANFEKSNHHDIKPGIRYFKF
ncbi:uncharacterized protein CMU_013520 [Cryptosporidium muris RN66]|uniref:Protein LTV1 homolog n=1 Tax=Cryptosporidium muris (strain RN66) TaxID=441375 RepID=B6AER0_CRYMR|nr:uncharacterized protein CMU_013520 [Cryptosporidium muris RN66]EEA06677.1 hypothetical protein, conserved [Cryptosporidium muris RN66]|eukprot:XP_002141026.1 hypothetical protein [Cryptosporidium muris RN66]